MARYRKIICSCCGEATHKTVSEINANKNRGVNGMYCSRECRAKSRRVEFKTEGTQECSNCKSVLPVDSFRVRVMYGRHYRLKRCRECERYINKLQGDPKKKRLAERKRFLDPNKRKSRNEYNNSYRNQDSEKWRAYHKKYFKKEIDDVSDMYVKSVLRHKGIRNEDITHEMIEIQRASILTYRIKRTIKKASDGKKQTGRPE